jgi:hypothetical protein
VNSSTTRTPTAEAVPVVVGAERALQVIGIVVAFPRELPRVDPLVWCGAAHSG